MHTLPRRFATSLLRAAALCGLLLPHAPALAAIWTNGNGDGVWENSANWNPAVVPNSIGETASFLDMPADQAITLQANVTIGHIAGFFGNVTNYTISNHTLIFDDGPGTSQANITSGIATNFTIQSNITLNSNLTFAFNNTGNLVLSGNTLNLNGHAFSLPGTGPTTISANITGAGAGSALNFSNSFPVTLTGNNTFGGPVTIGSGNVILSGGANRLPVTAVVTLGSGSFAGRLELGGDQELAGLTVNGGPLAGLVGGGSANITTLTLNIANGTNTYTGFLGSNLTPNHKNLALAKKGAGALELNGFVNYLGNTLVNEGSLTLSGNQTHIGGNSSNITVGGFDAGGSLTLQSSANATASFLTIMGTTAGNSSLTLDNASLHAVTMFYGGLGPVSGNVTGGALLDIFSSNLGGAGTTSDATLTVSGAGTQFSSTHLFIAEHGVLTIGSGAHGQWANMTVNQGAVVIAGGTANYTSQFVLSNGGHLTVGAGGVLSADNAAPLSVGAGSTVDLNDGGTIHLAELNNVSGAGAFNLNGGTLKTTFHDSAPTGMNFALGAGTNSTLEIGSGNATLSGALTGGGRLRKSGPGGLSVTGGNNTYTGGTTVVQGELRLANTSGSALGTGDVSVQAGATLGGSGAISGGVLLEPNGRLAPAMSGNFGNLSLGTLLWQGSTDSTPTMIFHLGDTTLSDQIHLTGNFLSTGTGSYIFDFLGTGASGDSGTRTYTLITFAGTTNFHESDFSFVNLAANYTGGFVLGANQLQFAVTPGNIPEPSTWTVVCGAVALLAVLRRRKQPSKQRNTRSS